MTLVGFLSKGDFAVGFCRRGDFAVGFLSKGDLAVGFLSKGDLESGESSPLDSVDDKQRTAMRQKDGVLINQLWEKNLNYCFD